MADRVHWEAIGYLVRSGIDPTVFVPQIDGMDEAEVCNAGRVNAVKRYVREHLAKEGISRVRFLKLRDGNYDVEFTKAWG